MNKETKTELQLITEETINSLLKASSKKQMESIWQQQWELIKQTKSNKGNTITSLTASNTVLRDIRKAVKTRLDPSKTTHKKKMDWLLYAPMKNSKTGEYSTVGIIRAGVEFSEKRDKITTNNFNESSKQHKTVERFNELLERIKIDIVKNTTNWDELAVMLGVVTGRRAIEILSTGNFTCPTDRSVKFKGIAKRKDNAQIIIPTLINGELVKKALKRIRSIKKLKEGNTDGTIRKQLNRAANKYLKDFRKDVLKFHDTRKIYTQWCFQTIHRKDNYFDFYNYNQREFTKAILGHSEEKSGKHYEDSFTITP